MITSTNGQSPYNALIAAATTGRPATPPTELALAPPTDEVDPAEGEFSFFGEDGFSFGDLVDIVNPLQHIPVVSTMYREASDDTLDAGSRMLGSTLFFGPIGLASSIMNVVIEQGTGKDIGEHFVSALFPDDSADNETEIAGIAAFNTAGGGDTGTDAPREYEQIDPVSAWAAKEVAWAREQQGIKRETAKLTENKPSQDVPDAQSFMNASYDHMAGNTSIQSFRAAFNASSAYESALNLALDRA